MPPCWFKRKRHPFYVADFSRAKCLLNADVAIILERKREAMEGKGQQPKSDFLKAYTYVNKVKQFRDRHVVVQVRKCVSTKSMSAHVARSTTCAGAHSMRSALSFIRMRSGTWRRTALSRLRWRNLATFVLRTPWRRKLSSRLSTCQTANVWVCATLIIHS